MSKNFGNILVGAIALMILLSLSMFVVDQRQTAIVFQLGEVVSVKTQPGLYFKLPLVQNVRLFDMRIQTFDDPEPLRFLTTGNIPVSVDSFVKWRVVDVKQYYVSVQGSELEAARRLKQLISDGLQT